jgi:hypothetical protein
MQKEEKMVLSVVVRAAQPGVSAPFLFAASTAC